MRHTAQATSAPAAQPFLATFSPAAIAGLLCDGDYLCLCAEEQGQLLGVVTLHRPAHLHHLFVAPTAHGRGIARQLWQALESHLDPAMPVTVNSSEYAVPFADNEYSYRILMGFADKCEILEPKNIRNEFISRIKKAAALYKM